MRLFFDSVIAAMLLAVLLGVAVHHRQGQQAVDKDIRVRDALAVLEEKLRYHAALEAASVTDPFATAFPPHLDPAWFDADPPLNPLAAAGHLWMDVAPEADRHDHPPDPVLQWPGQAGFWYSPRFGVIRVRVPMQVSEQATLDLYNRLNRTALPALPIEADPLRRPTIPQVMQWQAAPQTPVVRRPEFRKGQVQTDVPAQATPEPPEAPRERRPSLLRLHSLDG